MPPALPWGEPIKASPFGRGVTEGDGEGSVIKYLPTLSWERGKIWIKTIPVRITAQRPNGQE